MYPWDNRVIGKHFSKGCDRFKRYFFSKTGLFELVSSLTPRKGNV